MAWLLGSSYYFYMNWNPKYALLVLSSTAITFLSGIYLERAHTLENKKMKKWCVAVSFATNLAILFFYKYFNFMSENVSALFVKLGIGWDMPNFDILLPVGISFYTFQALSYTMDVYRGDLKAERHFGRYALFVSFFPQLVAGPIERSTHLLPQFYKEHKFNYDRLRDGLLLILWGLIKKVVIADRLAIFVNTIYENPTNYQGIPLITATVFFAFQIYCDFSAYSDIAIGTSKILGYELMENFKRPYLAKSIADFWGRWHISLTTWFRDYLYFPMGGSRVTQIKKYRNILVVFLVSGFWHGASWNFIIWGLLHSFYQISEIISKPLRDKLISVFKIKRESLAHRLFQIISTFILVNIAWVFFRANRLNDAIYIIKNIFIIKSFSLNQLGLDPSALEQLGLHAKEFYFSTALSAILIIILINIEVIQKKYVIRKLIVSQKLWVRWIIYILALHTLVIVGEYGSYTYQEFLYFQF